MASKAVDKIVLAAVRFVSDDHDVAPIRQFSSRRKTRRCRIGIATPCRGNPCGCPHSGCPPWGCLIRGCLIRNGFILGRYKTCPYIGQRLLNGGEGFILGRYKTCPYIGQKLLNGGKYNPARLPARKQFPQVCAALGLNRFLPQQLAAAAEDAEELVV
jgi:hypothetical protein